MKEDNIDGGVVEDEFDLAFGVAVGGGDFPEKESAAEEGATGAAASEGDEGTTAVSAVDNNTDSNAGADGQEKKAPVESKPEPKVDLEAERIASEASAKASVDAQAESERLQTEAISREALSPEEQAALKSVETDFPDTALALKAVERVAFTKAENAFNAKLKQIEARFEQKLVQLSTDFAPAVATAKTIAQQAHEAEILKYHADAFDILPEVEKWADTKPEFLKTTYNAVLDRGSASQIVKLYDIFKTEIGSVKGPPTSPTPEETAQKAAKEKKLQSLEGVRSRQAAQKGGIDEDDFESAFKAAANS